MKLKLKLVLMLALLANLSAYAVKVEGVVVDDKTKEPLIGASVSVKDNTNQAVSTNIDGKFFLDVADPKDAVLTVSYIGYKKKNVQLNGRTLLTIELEEDVKTMDEVVVVGYGNMRKSDLTGSVVSVNPKENEAARSISVDRMLQGKAAGLSVTTGSSAPGGAVNVRIRGTSSLRGDNSPLYVVDGSVITMDETRDPMSQGAGGGNSLMDSQNPLSQISPSDIANIEVLKDASATAIYGSRGANGVILITTKKGTTGKTQITLNSSVTGSTLFKEIPVLNSYEYIDFSNAFLTAGQAQMTMDGFTPVDWQKKSTRFAVSQNHNISLSGKTNKTSYYFSAGFLNNQGVVNKTNIRQENIRLNLEQELNDFISFKSYTFFSRLNTSMTSGTDKLANVRSSAVRHMISYKPLKGGTLTDEEYNEDLTTPEAWFTDYDDDSEDNQFNTNLTFDFKLAKWLKLELKGAYINRDKERMLWYGTGLFNGAQVNGKAGRSTIKSQSYNGQALLLYNKKFGKFNLSGTVGTEYNKKQLTSTSLTGENFFSKVLRAKGISLAAVQYPYFYQEVGEQLFSVLGRAVLSYDNKYTLTSTMRADGSSKFEPGKKFSYFPSFAFAWRVNQEGFMENISQISNLKLRAGWGQVGNQAVDAYQTRQFYNNVYYSNPDGTSSIGIVPAVIANPNLIWETSQQVNLGFDLGLFKQALSISVDLYEKRTRNLLLEINIPTSSGNSAMWINSKNVSNGGVQNRGLEVSFDANPINGKIFKLGFNGNISFVRSKILNLGLATSDFGMLHDVQGYLGTGLGNGSFNKFPVNIFLTGYPIGLYYGYQTNGIMQQAEYDAQLADQHLKYNGADIMPGDVKLVDQDGNHIVDAADQTIIGDPNPDFTYGFGTSMSYKRLSLDITFNGVYGNQIVNANLIDETDVSNATKNVRRVAYYEAWTPGNKSNTYPRLGYATTNVFMDRIIEDGSYLRLSNVSLSYELKLPKIKFINSIMLTASGNNLLCFTKYSGYSPDVNSFSNDPSRMGVDLTSYPASRNYTFGIIAKF